MLLMLLDNLGKFKIIIKLANKYEKLPVGAPSNSSLAPETVDIVENFLPESTKAPPVPDKTLDCLK